MATIEVIIYIVFIGVPSVIFLYWLYGVIRFLILPNRKIIRNFFTGISRALIITAVLLVGLAIATLIYHFEVPDKWYYGYDNNEIEREYNPFKRPL